MDSLMVSNSNHQTSPEIAALVASLKACAKQKDLYKGSRLHANILNRASLLKNVYIANTLVNFYARCGAVAKAKEVFDDIQVRDVISWNALLSGYTQSGHGDEALECFERMQCEGLSANAITFACMLKTCGSLQAAHKGSRIHAEIAREGLLAKDIFVATALVDMYAKCGVLEKAQEVFDKLKVRNIVSWNALISGYTQHGHSEKALNCYGQMQHAGISPDAVTFVCILKACGSIGAADKGKEVHADIVRGGLLEKNIWVGTALLDMYAKCGALEKAKEVFNELRVRNIISWNALIAGYAQHLYGNEALNCFEQMKCEGFSPEAVTFVCILKACGSIEAADKGREVHAEIVGEGLLDKDISIGTALVDMYAKCGALGKAQKVFDELPNRNVVSWTALIKGYAQHGHGVKALRCAERMESQGLLLDTVTFTVVLHACSHSGLLEKGQSFFEAMSSSCGIAPTSEHYSCMVDLFGRTGHLDKAVGVIKKMPASDSLPVWNVFLGACQKLKNVSLGRLAFDHAMQFDEKDAAAYVCMRNIYVTAGMHKEANQIEALRVNNKALKTSGRREWKV